MESSFTQLSIHLLGNRPEMLDRIRHCFSGPDESEYFRNIHFKWISDSAAAEVDLDDEDQTVLMIDISPENGGLHKHFNLIRKMVDRIPIIILTPYRDEELLLSILGLGVQDVVPESRMTDDTLRRAVLFALIRFHRTHLNRWTSYPVINTMQSMPDGKRSRGEEDMETLEHRFIEEALRESGRRFRDIAFSIHGWIWEMDTNGRFEYCSDKVKDNLGYRVEEMIGKTLFDFMGSEEAQKIRSVLESCVRDETPILDLEYWSIHRDGRPVCVLMDGVPVFDIKGRLRGYRGVSKDITSQKEIQLEREKLIAKLEDALDRIQTLSGLLPICSACKKIRDDRGNWNPLESYIQSHSRAAFSHSYCPDCASRLLSEIPDVRSCEYA